MNRIFTIGISFTLAAIAGLARTAQADLDKEKDFGQYSTYFWKDCEGEATVAGAENSLAHRRIRAAVDGEMAARGMFGVTERPDLYLLCSVGGRERVRYESTSIRPRGMYGWYGYRPHRSSGWSRDWTTVRPHHYREGQISLMMLDAETDELVWRAVAVDGSRKERTEPCGFKGKATRCILVVHLQQS